MSDTRFTAGLQHRFRLDVEDGILRHNRAEHPITGAAASIRSTGFLLTRRSYLTITGPGWSHTARIDSATMGKAERFAAAVNAAAQAASLAA